MVRQEIEKYYAAAFAAYESGSYTQAADLFTYLILQNQFDTRFWKGLASSKQMGKEYDAALRAWSSYCLLENRDPTAHFHAGECLLSIGNKTEAMKAFNLALQGITEGPLFEKIHLLQQRSQAHG